MALLVLEWATEYAASCNWKHVQWKCDTIVVVSDINVTWEPTGWRTKINIKDCMANWQRSQFIEWILKEANGVADFAIVFSFSNNINLFDESCILKRSQVCLESLDLDQISLDVQPL